MPPGTWAERPRGDVLQEIGFGLEEILVEILVTAGAGAEEEVAGDVGGVVDAPGEVGAGVTRHWAPRGRSS